MTADVFGQQFGNWPQSALTTRLFQQWCHYVVTYVAQQHRVTTADGQWRVRSNRQHDTSRLPCWQICSDSSRLSPTVVANSVHTADTSQIDSWVASESAVCMYWALRCRPLFKVYQPYIVRFKTCVTFLSPPAPPRPVKSHSGARPGKL